MLKKLLNLFGSSDAIALMGKDFSKMLDLSYETAVRGGQIFFEESPEADQRIHIFKSDVKINQLERRIRKQVITHVTLGSAPGDVPYCLLLMSLVKDAERIGDYAKNLAQVHYDGGASIPDDENGTEIREIRRLVEGTFAEARQVFTTSDADSATALIMQGRDVNKRCDALIMEVTRSDYDAATTTTIVLGARYYKRIESHVLNILSGVVMPLHKLDYYDERFFHDVSDSGNDSSASGDGSSDTEGLPS